MFWTTTPFQCKLAFNDIIWQSAQCFKPKWDNIKIMFMFLDTDIVNSNTTLT